MNYDLGSEYGYDQISVGPRDFCNFTHSPNANNLSNINDVTSREHSILKKINKFCPTYQDNRNKNIIDYCPHTVYSGANPNMKHGKLGMKRDVENYYQSGREYRIKNHGEQKKEDFAVDDLQYLHDELKHAESQNNMLLLFIFFLVIVVLAQYSKLISNTQPMQFMIVPTAGTGQIPQPPS